MSSDYVTKHRAIGHAAWKNGDDYDAMHGQKTALYVAAFALKVQNAYTEGWNAAAAGEPLEPVDVTPAKPKERTDLFG